MCQLECVPGKTDCCCHCLLFTQPDFIAQKSHLEEFITSHGHICDFYPKYHCELNFIEQYWGAANFHYRQSIGAPQRQPTLMRWKNVIGGPSTSNSEVICQSDFVYKCTNNTQDMQTGQQGLLMLMPKDFLDQKQHGQTGSIMVIIHFHQT